MSNNKKITAVDVYFEKIKSREYVGQLTRQDSKYIFTYADAYLAKDRSIPLGPDLPLTAKSFTAATLFPSFEDRIPSKKNPAYPEYCKIVGIDPKETDELVLVATLGQKGPSSFIFAPSTALNITINDIIAFRQQLDLTVREFSDIFDFGSATIHRLEKNKTSGKDALKRLEIYYHFPAVALYELAKNGHKINDTKREYVKKILEAKNNTS